MTRHIGISVPHRKVVDEDDDIQTYKRAWVSLTDEQILTKSKTSSMVALQNSSTPEQTYSFLNSRHPNCSHCRSLNGVC